MDGTVLVADDDRTIRTVLTQALTRAGCKVHATSSLVTLMRWVEEGKGDLVISDVVMPDGNGLEALPAIGRERPGLPVIVISAQNTIMTAIQAAEADAFDYLPKPFDLPDLMKRAARALSSKRQSAPVASQAARDGSSNAARRKRRTAARSLIGYHTATQAVDQRDRICSSASSTRSNSDPCALWTVIASAVWCGGRRSGGTARHRPPPVVAGAGSY